MHHMRFAEYTYGPTRMRFNNEPKDNKDLANKNELQTSMDMLSIYI